MLVKASYHRQLLPPENRKLFDFAATFPMLHPPILTGIWNWMIF